jgi:hypothetical protein
MISGIFYLQNYYYHCLVFHRILILKTWIFGPCPNFFIRQLPKFCGYFFPLINAALPYRMILYMFPRKENSFINSPFNIFAS